MDITDRKAIVMKKLESGGAIVARATMGSYFVLSGVYFLLAAVNVWLGISRGWGGGVSQATLLLLTIGFAWIVWLQGFKIVVSSKTITYRNGFYRQIQIPLEEIATVKSAWVEWKVLGRHLRVPRLVLTQKSSGAEEILINAKPFGRSDIKAILDIINKSPGK